MRPQTAVVLGRRTFTIGSSAVIAGCAAAPHRRDDTLAEPEHEDVSATEDLMREHGILERALLIYEASLARMSDKAVLAIVGDTADVLRSFIEDYHEKLEEEFVFPRLEEAGRIVDVVAVLRTQHERGRALTDEIRRGGDEARLSAALRAYVTMYRPHAAREDTLVFPTFREVVRGPDYDELGERFEEREHALFGEGGFHTVVARIAELERALGIEDLATFTPRHSVP